MQNDFNVVANVFEMYIQIVTSNVLRDVVEDQVAVSVGTSHFERRFVVAGATPAGIFLRIEHLRRIERGDVTVSGKRGKIIRACNRGSPVDVLQLAVRSNSEGIGTLGRREHPDTRTFEVADRLGICGREREHGNSDQTGGKSKHGRIRL